MWKLIIAGLAAAGGVWFIRRNKTQIAGCQKPSFQMYDVPVPSKAQASALKTKYGAATIRAATSSNSRAPWQEPQPGMAYSQVMTHWLVALDANGCFLGGEQDRITEPLSADV